MEVSEWIRNIKLVIVSLGLGTVGVFAQNIDELRTNRQTYLNEISITEDLLSKATNSMNDQVAKLRLLNGNISKRQKVVSGISKEMIYLDTIIRQRERDIEKLETDLRTLKADYSRMIIKAYKTKKSYDKAQYILAAADFNQAFKRIRYMQQYNRFRRSQAEEISGKTIVLNREIENYTADKKEKEELLLTQKNAMVRLTNERRQKNDLVGKLTKQQRSIKKDLEAQKRSMAKIEEEIARLISEARGESEDRSLQLTPEMKIISNRFGQNKGRIPWPVERGVIISKYGKHKHEVLKAVDVDNKGVDIATTAGSKVRSVFEGKVSSVIAIRGANLTVIIQHGEFFSVYKGLVDVKVKKGNVVQAKQTIGKAYTDTGSESSELHFQLWKGSQTQNPESWLAK